MTGRVSGYIRNKKGIAYNSVCQKSSFDQDGRGPHYIGDVPKQRIQADVTIATIRKLTFGLETPHVVILGEEPLDAMLGRVFQLGKIGPIRIGV